MNDKLFRRIRLKLTISYTLIFTVLFLLIVVLSNVLAWGTLLHHKKLEIVEAGRNEAREYVEYSNFPVGEAAVRSGVEMAYMKSMEGTPMLDLLGTTPQGVTLLHKQDIWPQENDKARLVHFKAEGRRFYFLINRTLMVEKKEPVGYLYLFRNVNNYYYAAWHIFRNLFWVVLGMIVMAAALGYDFAGRHLQPLWQAYDKQRQFTADASHEMRTPLAVMNLATQSVTTDLDSKLSSFSGEALTMMQQEIKRLTKLTEQLMGLAREDSNALVDFPEFMETVDLSTLARQTVEELRLVAKGKEITIESQIAPDVSVQGDAESLKRLLIILLDNAIKYSEANTKIVVTLGKDNNEVVLRVADEGPGISDQHKTKIFDRFYRVDKARSRAQGGNGLGLSLAQAIVQRHKGTIEVTDNQPHGSVFKIILKE